MKIEFVFLRSYGTENSLARLQSEPLIQGLEGLGYNTLLIQYKNGEKIELPDSIYWLFIHHDDTPSILAAKEIKKITNCKIACLTSDIYNYDRYTEIDKIVDLFIAPTNLHKKTLQYAVYNHIIYIPECIDPIAIGNGNGNTQEKRMDEICWFGYPESFEKSLKYIIKKLEYDQLFEFKKLGIITRLGCNLHPLAKHAEFSVNTFTEMTKDYGYSLLSHFPYDHHINTYIKSPNKLITSIVLGLIPIVSDTENYHEVANNLGINGILCRSPIEMVHKIYNMNYDFDSKIYNLESCASHLKQELSSEKITKKLLQEI